MKPINKKKQMHQIIKLLKEEYPISRTSLKYNTPFQLLISTILSAQCTDIRVNQVTEKLFKKFKKPGDFARVDIIELEQAIRPTGFYRQKAKNIKNSTILIINKFNGEVPRTMEDIIMLPGVGRKTANVVLSSAYGIVEGIAVDTHVKRLSFRLGLSDHTDPDRIERDLMKLAPRSEWKDMSLRIIFHGRLVCTARKPGHDICILKHLCSQKGVEE